MKKITKITIYYDDGTYEDIQRSCAPTVKIEPTAPDPYNVPTPWVIAPCAQCGRTDKGACQRTDCPTGWGRPWDNSTKVVD